MIKRLSRDLFPQKAGLFLIFCLQEGISEDLKIWPILFSQGWAEAVTELEGVGSTTSLPLWTVLQGLRGEKKHLSLVKQASFTLLSSSVYSQKLLEIDRVTGDLWEAPPSSNSFYLPYCFDLKVLFYLEQQLVHLWYSEGHTQYWIKYLLEIYNMRIWKQLNNNTFSIWQTLQHHVQY